MPTHPTKPVTTSYKNVLLGDDGQPLITIDVNEFSIVQPDGSILVQKNNTSIVLADQTTWSPLVYRDRPPIDLGICLQCRRGMQGWFHSESPTHGICNMQNMQRCAGECAELLCPRHRRLCADGNFRCIRCAARFRWGSLLSSLFFRQ